MKVVTYSLISVLILLLVLSGYSLAGSYLTRSSSVTVGSIDSSSDCGPLKIGDRIVSVESRIIRSSSDFSSADSTVKAGDYVAMVVNGGPGSCRALSDGNLGFTVKESSSGGLMFGPDISESKSFVYSANNSNSTTLAKIKKVIQDRVNFYDLPQTRVEITGSNIKISTPFEDEINSIVRQSKLRGTVIESFTLEQGAAKIIVGNTAYIVKPGNETISINGTDFPADKPFELSNVTFHYVDTTGPTINVEADLHGEEDTVVNPTSQVIVRKEPQSGFYFYYVQVSVAPDVNERLTKVIRKAESTLVPGGGTVLNARLNYYIDDEEVSSLAIPVELIGNEITAISGIQQTSEDAYKVGRLVYSSLRFGSLPADLKLESQDISEPTVNKTVLYGTLGVGFLSTLIVLGYTYSKTKKIKVVSLMFVMTMLEILISVGLLVAMTKYLNITLLIDYPVLIGISFLSIYSALTLFVYFEGLEGRHKHIIVGYKKIMSLMNFFRIVMLGSILVGIIGYRGMAFVLLAGFFLDELLMKQLFKTLTSGKT